ncbi:unnamed protein product [Ilex paraguariensis]|uniref:Transcription repressor n=1 Tax=Ilex paraguariensis TaxID=185542 RepID=A0ABC8RSD0_9AQUA
MPSTLGRNLNLCFTKFKRTSSPQPSLQEDDSRSLPNSTTSFLIKNFNSLYDLTLDCATTSKLLSRSSSDDNLSTAVESDRTDTETTTPDFATVFASKRFFFSSPGRSNSIIESSSSISSAASTSSLLPDNPSESETLVGGSIAIPTYSPDPYMDFRRSMQEMVEARNLIDVRANWDYLHELLMSYLALNPKSTHKFIVGAFADLLVSLMTLPVEGGRRRSEVSGGGRQITRRRMYRFPHHSHSHPCAHLSHSGFGGVDLLAPAIFNAPVAPSNDLFLGTVIKHEIGRYLFITDAMFIDRPLNQ